jgi:26S proteasome regulatory subunit N9
MEFLQELMAGNPPYFEEVFSRISRQVKTRYWYELGGSFLELLRSEPLEGERKDLYDKVISQFDQVLDPFHLGQILQLVSDDIPSATGSRAFLESSLPKLKTSPDATCWVRLQMVPPLIANGDFETAFATIVSVEGVIGDGTDPAVRALFYRVFCALDKARSDHDAFYEHGFLFLSASSTSGDILFAYDLCVAALCAERVYSFGELFSHEVLRYLRGTENEWLRNLIGLMTNGSPEIIEQFQNKFLPILTVKRVFVPYVSRIETKIKLCVLQEMIFQSPYDRRVFTFAQVANLLGVPAKEAEILVLRALSCGLIDGFIDQVGDKFAVTWCKPKGLARDGLIHLRNELERWTAVVHQRRDMLERRSRSVIG